MTETKITSDFTEQTNPKRIQYSFYQKLFFLYFLNLVDWICTEALLASGKFYEANPIMQPVLNGFWNTMLIKGIAPLAMVCLCAIIFKALGAEQTRFTNAMLYVGISAYALLNLWHIVNFVLLFFYF